MGTKQPGVSDPNETARWHTGSPQLQRRLVCRPACPGPGRVQTALPPRGTRVQRGGATHPAGTGRVRNPDMCAAQGPDSYAAGWGLRLSVPGPQSALLRPPSADSAELRQAAHTALLAPLTLSGKATRHLVRVSEHRSRWAHQAPTARPSCALEVLSSVPGPPRDASSSEPCLTTSTPSLHLASVTPSGQLQSACFLAFKHVFDKAEKKNLKTRFLWPARRV